MSCEYTCMDAIYHGVFLVFWINGDVQRDVMVLGGIVMCSLEYDWCLEA